MKAPPLSISQLRHAAELAVIEARSLEVIATAILNDDGKDALTTVVIAAMFIAASAKAEAFNNEAERLAMEMAANDG